MIRLTVACLLGVCVWLCQADIPAQDASVPAPPPPDQKGELVIRRAPLDVFVLVDDEGNRFSPLPGGWSLTKMDDFQRFLLQKDQQSPVPSFIIRNVSATGTIVDHYVATDVQVELVTSGYQPVRIPLGFKEGIFPSENLTGQPPFRYVGNGAAFLTVDTKEGQYVAVVVPQTEQVTESENRDKSEKPELTQPHTLVFSLWLPLVQSGGGENRLPLSFPQALSSQFLLEVPMENVTVSVTQGSILTAQENADQQSTQLKVQGLRADSEITWKKKKIEIVDDRPVLIVESASIDVRLEAHSAIYDAILPISSATGSFEQLQIRLPRGSVLDRETSDRYAAAGDYSLGNVDEQSVMTVQFPQKIVGAVSVRLKVEQQLEVEGERPDFEHELAGFEILGAERQSGFLNVSVFPSEMKPRWEHVRGIRRAEGINPSTGAPATSAVSPSMGETRFEFISQPFRLRVRAISPQTRINVKPDYQFQISRGLIRMTARLSYTVSGSKTDVLHLQLSDAQWNCEVGPSSRVDVDDVELDASGLLTIPLRSPSDGTFDIEVRARRSIASDDEQTHRIVLPMPDPRVTWSESAPVMILLADNVEALPVDDSYSAASKQRTSGMTRQSRRTMPLRTDLPDLQQEPLFYRTESAEAVFVADLIYHQQQINTTMQTRVQLLEDYNQVTQIISYHAVYAPIDRLYFLLPESLEANGDLQIRLENRTLELRDTIADIRENIPTGWKQKILLLPEPKFQFELTFQYSSPPFTVPADVTALCTLLFICPANVPVEDHRIHFFAPSDYKIELQDESKSLWESFRESRRLALGATGTFRSVQPPNKIALSISVSEKNDSSTTIVERAWVQTWLTGTIRVDRATYLLKTARDSVTLQLPPLSLGEHPIFVWVNRQPVQPNVSPTGLLTFPILPEQHNRAVEISVEYRYTFSMSGMEVPIILPTFSKDTLIQYEFWQVILPPNKHILACSGGWTLEYDWSWNGLFLGRTPSIRKSDIGFETDDKMIDSRGSQYLFSHLHPSGYVTLYIVSRPLIILGSSSLALLVGLVLIYVRQSRYAGSLFGLGVILIAVLFYQLPLVLLMLQAAVFGVFLALGAGYVYRIFHRQKQWIPSTFPSLGEMSHLYPTPLPSQTIHEVVIDEESASKYDTPLVPNPHKDTPPTG